MLGIFRSSLPSRLILLIGVAIIFIGLSIMFPKPMEISHFQLLLNASKLNDNLYLYNNIYDYSGLIPAYLNSFFVHFFGYQSTISKIFVGFLILMNAIYFNSIIDKYRLIEERSFIPGFICLLMSFSFYQNLELTSIVIGNLFITLSISSLFKSGQENTDTTHGAYTAGAFMGIAFICEQIFIFYFILGIIALLYYSPKGFKSFIALFIGWTLPIIIVFNIYLFYGYQEDFLYYYFYAYFLKSVENSVSISFYFPWFIGAIIIVFFYTIKRATKSFKNYTSKALQLIIVWLLIAVACIFFIKERQLSMVYLMVNPIAFFISFYSLLVKRKWALHLIPFFSILFILFFNLMYSKNFLINQKEITSNTIHDEKVKYDGKVLLLENNPSFYFNNQHGSSFTNWNLEKKAFLNLNEYGNLEKVYLGITSDYPKYIVDPNNMFSRVMARVPLFRKKYIKVDSKTYRLISAD